MVPKHARSLFRGLFFLNSVALVLVSLFSCVTAQARPPFRGTIGSDLRSTDASPSSCGPGRKCGAGACRPGRKYRRTAEAATRAAEAQVGAGGRVPAVGRSRGPPWSRHAGWRGGHGSPALCRTLPISIVTTGNLIKPGAINP